MHKVIDKVREWICVNFDIGTRYTLIRNFERETRTYLKAEKQIKEEDREKD